jgi:Tfp pilus assembly protein FimT
MKAIHNEKGLTLVEVGITLAVVAILSVLAMPNFRGMIQRYRFDAAVRTMANDLALVRLKAISRNREMRVRVDDTDDKYIVEQGNASDSSTSWNAEAPSEGKTLGTDIDIYQIDNLDADTVNFKTNGILNDSSSDVARIYIEGLEGLKKKRIVITKYNGRINLEYCTGGDNWKDERDK